MLWSNTSGEDMVRAWLRQHPEVAERRKSNNSQQKKDKTALTKKPKETPPTLAILPHIKELAKELDVYEQTHRGLPVSLMPSSRQPPPLHSSDVADWG